VLRSNYAAGCPINIFLFLPPFSSRYHKFNSPIVTESGSFGCCPMAKFAKNGHKNNGSKFFIIALFLVNRKKTSRCEK
jgi:hypothetical protein